MEWVRLPEVPVTVSVYAPAGVPAAAAGVTVRVAVFFVPAYEAVIVTEVEALTELVFTVNIALLAPAATVTVPGTVAAAMSLER